MVQNFSKNFFSPLLPVFMPTDPLVLKFGTTTLECFLKISKACMTFLTS